MKDKIDKAEQAIKDIEAIRSLLEASGKSSEDYALSLPQIIKTKVIIHIGALGAAGGLLYNELFINRMHTTLLMKSAHDGMVLKLGIAGMVFYLLLLIGSAYYIVSRAAAKSKVGFTAYLAKHFQYLSYLSLLSDITIKCLILVALAVIGKPELWAPALSLFTAEYLLQGRFFDLPLPLALIAGVVCLGAAIVQFYSGIPDLIYPLFLFVAIGAVSMVRLAISMNNKNKASDAN